jgi:hypothetical protein
MLRPTVALRLVFDRKEHQHMGITINRRYRDAIYDG